MKNRLWIPVTILLVVGIQVMARQSPTANASDPCNEITSNIAAGSDKVEKKKESIEHDPLADPIEEMRTRNQKKLDEKNFKELQDAATELAAISTRMSKEIDAGGPYVISLRVQNDLEQIEKLTRKVRSRAK